MKLNELCKEHPDTEEEEVLTKNEDARQPEGLAFTRMFDQQIAQRLRTATQARWTPQYTIQGRDVIVTYTDDAAQDTADTARG